MKRVSIVILCTAIIVLLAFTHCFIQNQIMRVTIKSGNPWTKNISSLGIVEPTKYYYNKGAAAYSDADYDIAQSNFSKALKFNHSDKRDCDIRVNLALSMVTPLNLDHVTDSNRDSLIETLEAARDILLANECAKDDGNGHDYDAQVLKDEIDEELKKLRQEQDDPDKKEPETTEDDSTTENPDDSTTENPEDSTTEDPNKGESTEETTEQSTEETTEQNTEEGTTTEEPTDEENLKQQFDDMRKQGDLERGSTLENYKHFYEFDYYDGKSW